MERAGRIVLHQLLAVGSQRMAVLRRIEFRCEAEAVFRWGHGWSPAVPEASRMVRRVRHTRETPLTISIKPGLRCDARHTKGDARLKRNELRPLNMVRSQGPTR